MQGAQAGLLLVLLAAAVATARGSPPANAEAGAAPRDSTYRLPGDVVPAHYAVHIAPRRPGSSATDQLYFDGTVDITAHVVRDISTIVMHASNNIVRKGILMDLTYAKNTEKEFLTIYLFDTLKEKEEINIQITYTGKFPERMEGFYKSTYNYINNVGEANTRVLFATQFEPTYARKAFPAFDEPRYKATFQLSIDPPPGFSALSNTPVYDRKIRNENGRKIDTIIFQETPRMSVYLLAFLVYEEDTYAHTATSETDVPITSWAPKGDIDAGQAQFSQSETPKILSVMEEYTGIPFAQGNIEKIDEVAIPDFTAGAMENWGLITYREDTLLVDPDQGTAHDRQYVSEVISHEIAHQWFGNLVTPKLWDYAWLSEGFARYFQYWIPGQ
ncbi:Membrane alanyl aminopeptidase, partial [Gryllus bimaculatus]